MAVIGIDLGTTNSIGACWKDGKVILIPDDTGEVLVPSVVGYLEKEGVLVGREAKERLMTYSGRTASSFKRFMGTKKQISLGNKEYTPVELSAMVLAKIKENAENYLHEPVEEAVITVPAYFHDKQRSDTKKAAQIAGLHVERLINEPSAAALAYRTKSGGEDKSLLVFDFGGGTLDLSYVECFDNVIEIMAVAGDNHLGGDDIDRLIAECVCKEQGLIMDELDAGDQAALIRVCEKAKKDLSQQENVCIAANIEGRQIEAVLTENTLFSICMPLWIKIKQLFLHVLEDAQVRVSELDDLIMVGGSSRLKVVRRFLTELLGKEPIVLGRTDQVVAIGVGVYTGIRQREKEVRELILTDVCPFTLGVEVHHRQNDQQGYMLPLIERNSTLPAFRCERLVTLYDYQSMVSVKIYQGEEYYAKDNIFLGEVSIEIPRQKAGKEWVDVHFSYDINGILHVEVENSKGERNQILLANQTLSEAELKAYRKNMEEFMMPPAMRRENEQMLDELSKYYEEAVGWRKEQIGSAIDWFHANLQSGRLYKIKQAAGQTREFLKEVRQWKDNREDILFDGEQKQQYEW